MSWSTSAAISPTRPPPASSSPRSARSGFWTPESRAEPWPHGTYANFQITGITGVPAGATAVLLNATVTNTTAPSFLTAYPNTKPTASDLNWMVGQTIPNLTLTTLSSTGAANFYNLAGSTDLLLDISCWFS